ncbi:hypothetical protein, partial [Enterobacter intestinihominis]
FFVFQLCSGVSLALVSLYNVPDVLCFFSALRPRVPPLIFPGMVGVSYRHGEGVAGSIHG